LATCLARHFTGLPYVYAPIRYRRREDGYRFDCPGPEFAAEWTAAGPAAEVSPDSIDAWLLERYALYVEDRRGGILRTEVDHRPWIVHRVRSTVRASGLGSPFGLSLGAEPDATHFSDGVRARIWPFASADARKPVSLTY